MRRRRRRADRLVKIAYLSSRKRERERERRYGVIYNNI